MIWGNCFYSTRYILCYLFHVNLLLSFISDNDYLLYFHFLIKFACVQFIRITFQQFIMLWDILLQYLYALLHQLIIVRRYPFKKKTTETKPSSVLLHYISLSKTTLNLGVGNTVIVWLIHWNIIALNSLTDFAVRSMVYDKESFKWSMVRHRKRTKLYLFDFKAMIGYKILHVLIVVITNTTRNSKTTP